MRVALLAGRCRCSVGLGFLAAHYLTPLLLLYTSLGAGKGITPQDKQTPVVLQIPAVTPATPAPPVCLPRGEHEYPQAPLQVPLVEFRRTQEDDPPLWVQTAAPKRRRENPFLLPGVKQLNQLDLGI